MKYYNLKYTDIGIDEKDAGNTKAWIIRIRPKYRYDIGLLNHEITHVKQFWLTLGFHGLLYLLVKPYKLWAEILAYRVQLKWVADVLKEVNMRKFANRISTRYGLNISEEEAYNKLK